MKPVSPAAAYVLMIPRLMDAAREVGYALAVHGSMGRDLDLIAVPWTEKAESATALMLRIMSAAGYFGGAYLGPRTTDKDRNEAQSNGDVPGKKPHGRMSWSIHFRDSDLYLDVSVMPRTNAQGPQANHPQANQIQPRTKEQSDE